MRSTVYDSDGSEHSSVISISDKDTHSDLEVVPMDNQKYRLPETGKAKTPTSMDAYEPPAPPPPPKDSPDIPDPSPPAEAGANESDPTSYFNPYGLSRAGSVYSLSRVAFTTQISQLTSIPLPQAGTLSKSIAAIPTSAAAAKALNEAAEQIRRWMQKASDVLNGLDAEDDVEWAAAGGREGIEEVDAALTRFESLIDVYVTAIEEIQTRKDAATLSAQEQNKLVGQMEQILKERTRIKNNLKGVKGQVEIAMEWEELWSTVLGEIGLELDALGRLVFEMEERRHRVVGDALSDNVNGLDLNELKTVVEEAPRSPMAADHRQSLSAAASPRAAPVAEDSKLLALFARMQPLRASLDFLPMRLSVYFTRAKPSFPTACDELDQRRDQLESRWKKLQEDAEALRKEFSEDQWVDIFRKAATKAYKMWESVNRSVAKLGEAIDAIEDYHTTFKKIASYKDKKTYYFPAIESVMTIIDTGIRDRLTVNGEIVRLQADLRNKFSSIQEEVKAMDALLLHDLGVDVSKDLAFDKTRESSLSRSSSLMADRNEHAQQLRDSMSTVATDQSLVGSAIDTPGSSPASSIIMSRKSSEYGNPSTPYGKSRQSSFASSAKSKLNSSLQSRRFSSLPTSASSSLPRKLSHVTPPSRGSDASTTPTGRPSSRLAVSTPTPSRFGPRAATSQGHRPPSSVADPSKPRWNASTNMRGTTTGHQNPPVSQPRSLRSVSSHSSIPVPSPLGPGSRSRTPSATSSLAGPSPTASTYAPYSQRQSSASLRTPQPQRGLRPQASVGNMGASATSNSSTRKERFGYVQSSGYGRASTTGRTSVAGSRCASAYVEPDTSPSTTAAKRAMASASRSVSAMSGTLSSGRRSSMMPQRPGAENSTSSKGKAPDRRPIWR